MLCISLYIVDVFSLALPVMQLCCHLHCEGSCRFESIMGNGLTFRGGYNSVEIGLLISEKWSTLKGTQLTFYLNLYQAVISPTRFLLDR